MLILGSVFTLMTKMTIVYGMKKMGVLDHDVKQMGSDKKMPYGKQKLRSVLSRISLIKSSTFDHNESFIVMMNEYAPHLFILFLAIRSVNTMNQ